MQDAKLEQPSSLLTLTLQKPPPGFRKGLPDQLPPFPPPCNGNGAVLSTAPVKNQRVPARASGALTSGLHRGRQDVLSGRQRDEKSKRD